MSNDHRTVLVNERGDTIRRPRPPIRMPNPENLKWFLVGVLIPTVAIVAALLPFVMSKFGAPYESNVSDPEIAIVGGRTVFYFSVSVANATDHDVYFHRLEFYAELGSESVELEAMIDSDSPWWPAVPKSQSLLANTAGPIGRDAVIRGWHAFLVEENLQRPRAITIVIEDSSRNTYARTHELNWDKERRPVKLISEGPSVTAQDGFGMAVWSKNLYEETSLVPSREPSEGEIRPAHQEFVIRQTETGVFFEGDNPSWVVLADDPKWATSVIAVLDFSSGDLDFVFVNSGDVLGCFVHDLDSDGIDEISCQGVNNNIGQWLFNKGVNYPKRTVSVGFLLEPVDGGRFTSPGAGLAGYEEGGFSWYVIGHPPTEPIRLSVVDINHDRESEIDLQVGAGPSYYIDRRGALVDFSLNDAWTTKAVFGPPPALVGFEMHHGKVRTYAKHTVPDAGATLVEYYSADQMTYINKLLSIGN